MKTQMFRSPKYLGDPINAIKIFNEKKADELLVLDIDATANGVEPNYNLIAKFAAECRMPVCYGGGITSAEQALRIIDLGVEKVAMSAAAIENPNLLTEIANTIGRQSVVAVLDVRKKIGLFSKGYEICTHNGKITHNLAPSTVAKTLQDAGAGEIVLNSVDCDGEMKGYDLMLAQQMREVLSVPMTVLGGAGSLSDIGALIRACGVVGAGVGSLFVFKGKYRAVLINYPTMLKRDEIFQNANV